mmetsp:Transcript_2418/g.5056  ORF Transcript_2418/g.5056 Transcript_2418/m.5056 type:complete len:81 (-) Transcript_2418:218-460(-)
MLPASSLMERIDVNGRNSHEVYKFLRAEGQASEKTGPAIEWNFTKFVVGRGGQVLGRFPQSTSPAFFDEQMPVWLGLTES